MLPDELFLFTTCLAVHNTELNGVQKQNQERIEHKIDLILQKLDELDKKISNNKGQ